jgi:hypothetical protein
MLFGSPGLFAIETARSAVASVSLDAVPQRQQVLEPQVVLVADGSHGRGGYRGRIGIIKLA